MVNIVCEKKETAGSVGEAGRGLGLGPYLAAEQHLVDTALKDILDSGPNQGSTIYRAMHYSIFAGGKRFRPILTLAAGRSLGAPQEHLLPAACAVEMIHTYSLIHDDLPAMDNDDMRRGQPTSHRVFGEAVAILAGDALMTRAFQVLAEYPLEKGLEGRRLQAIGILAKACGPDGMVAGQVEDLAWEGREDITEETVRLIHKGKTAALIRACAMIGAVMADGGEDFLRIMDIYGENLGMAFQIIDDILDVVMDSADLGKTAGKDVVQKKATYPSVLGLEESRRRAGQHIHDALMVLEPMREKGLRLRQLAEFVAQRQS